MDREIIIDDRVLISSKLIEWCKRIDIDVVISTGGTGLSHGIVQPYKKNKSQVWADLLVWRLINSKNSARI